MDRYSEVIEAIVLWHYQDAKGHTVSASTTRFSGTMVELQEMIKETPNKNKKEQNLAVPHQIIILSCKL